jgi:hypothetical protein
MTNQMVDRDLVKRRAIYKISVTIDTLVNVHSGQLIVLLLLEEQLLT